MLLSQAGAFFSARRVGLSGRLRGTGQARPSLLLEALQLYCPLAKKQSTAHLPELRGVHTKNRESPADESRRADWSKEELFYSPYYVNGRWVPFWHTLPATYDTLICNISCPFRYIFSYKSDHLYHGRLKYFITFFVSSPSFADIALLCHSAGRSQEHAIDQSIAHSPPHRILNSSTRSGRGIGQLYAL